MAQKNKKQEIYAPRMSRPGLRDPKLLIGILLIALSVFAVVGIIRVSNRTETFYVASRDLHIGDKVSLADLTEIQVNLADSSSQYVSKEDNPLTENTMLLDEVQKGELLEKRNLAEQDNQGRRSVTVLQETAITNNLATGQLVDIWVSKKQEAGGGYQEPGQVAQAAEISVIAAEESIIGGTGKSAVTLLVPEDSLVNLLSAVNNSDQINLIPSQKLGEG